VRRALVLALAVPFAGCGGTASVVTRPSSPPPLPAPFHVRAPRSRAARAQRAELRRLLAAGRPVFCGGHRGRMVAFTFDDGPGVYTGLALNELRRAGALATFFLVGKSIARFPAWPRREARIAALGDHTQHHLLLAALSAPAAQREIAAGLASARRASGEPIRLFRPPYGADTPFVTATARRLGMVEIMWSIDSGDSIGGNFHQIAARVREGLRPGSIVLFHENRGQTIRALRSLLPDLRRRHLRAVTVPELLAADPPSAAQLRGGQIACFGVRRRR